MKIAFGTDERTALTDELQRLLAERGDEVVVVGEGDPWPGRRGRITPEWIKELVGPDSSNTIFYACGPNALVDAAEHLVLHEIGLPKEQLKLEKWG